jgi:hypothetical protein
MSGSEEIGCSNFFAAMGCASALVFANMGAAYGTTKSGLDVASMSVIRPELVMRSIVPIVMAGVIGLSFILNLFNDFFISFFFFFSIFLELLFSQIILFHFFKRDLWSDHCCCDCG